MPINYIKKYISTDELEEIQEEISFIEKQTSGEIRICFKARRGIFDKKLSPRDIALKEFYNLGVDKTADKTGVLIFILFSERKFEIVADEGINSKIPVEKWNFITTLLSDEFKNSNYKNGIIKCLNEIKEVLIKEFPVKSGDIDELPNEIVIK